MAREAGCSLVLLAHHRRDQAETVLLQALRGAGRPAWRRCRRLAERAGLSWARPWLHQPRRAVDAYVQRHRLQPVDDPSNADDRLARNRLRLQLWPALEAAFPHAETSLAAAAVRAQEARAALDELAALDLATLVDADGALAVAGWRALSTARQANALRAWWAAQAGHSAPLALVSRLLAEVPAKGVARWPAGAGWWCLLRGGRLRVVAPAGGAG
jgi:tRNA(Ile)-lysidine synthase